MLAKGDRHAAGSRLGKASHAEDCSGLQPICGYPFDPPGYSRYARYTTLPQGRIDAPDWQFEASPRALALLICGLQWLGEREHSDHRGIIREHRDFRGLLCAPAAVALHRRDAKNDLI